MVDFTIKRGETRTVSFEATEPGGAAMDLTGLTVTLAYDGQGTHATLAGTVDTPASAGLGSFALAAPDVPTTRRGRRLRDPYTFEVWVHSGGTQIPVLSGSFDVDDVPQRA